MADYSLPLPSTEVRAMGNVTDCYGRKRDRRACKYCPTDYGMGTSTSTLLEHMWRLHAAEALQLNLPEAYSQKAKRKAEADIRAARRPSSFSLSTSSSSSSSFSSSSSAPQPAPSSLSSSMLVDDDDDLSDANPLLRPLPASSILSSGSGSSSSSTSSSQMARIRAKYKQQQSVMDLWRRGSVSTATEEALNAQAEFFMYEGVPFRVADSPMLHKWLELLLKGDGTVASRREMMRRGHQRADSVRERVTDVLQRNEGVTVGVDGWTNVNGHKVLNLVPVAGGVAYYWNSMVLKGHAAAEDQEEPVRDGLHSLIKRGIRVTAIVTDNEKVNPALYQRLLSTFPFLLHIPCAAHTIQLCVRHIMKLKGVWELQDALIALLAAYKASKLLRVSLAKQQLLFNANALPLKIVKANDTRWNSLLMAAQRVVQLSTSITPFTAEIRKQLAKTKGATKRARWTQYLYDNDTFWEPLKTLIKFLLPYKTATDVVQSDTSTPFDIHHQFSILMKEANSLSPPHFLAPLKRKILRQIRIQWDTHVNKNSIVTSAHLSFEPSYDTFSDQQKEEANDWFINWGTEYLHYYNLARPEAENKQAITVLLMHQYGEFRRRAGAFTNIDAKHNLLYNAHQQEQRRLPPKKQRPYNPRVSWSQSSVNELATLAVALLSVTASEAAVERSFSRQGIIHSKLRNRLSDDSVHMQMFFSFNSRALEQPNRHQSASVAELEEEDEETKKAAALLNGAQYYDDDEIVAVASEDEQKDGQERQEGQEEKSDDEEEQLAVVLQELELDDEGEEEEEEEEKKEDETQEKEEKTEAENLADFVKKYAEDNNLVRGFRLRDWQRSALQSMLLEQNIRTQEGNVIAALRKHVRDKAAAQEEKMDS
jgi:hypothetical protein